MKRVIAMLILINLMLVSATTLAQQAREAAPVVQPGQTQDGSTHVVSYGETLGGIADSYGIDLYELMRINELYSHVIFPGRILHLPTSSVSAETIELPQPEASPGKHVVKYGETLGTIAAAYGIDLNALIIENGIFGHIIYPGQVLILPGATAEVSDPPPASEPVVVAIVQPIIPSQVTYVVRPGDTLGELAQAYGITLLTLMRANDIYYPHHIVVGQQLQVPSTSSLRLTVDNVEPFIDVSASETGASAPATDAPPLDIVESQADAPVEAEIEPPAVFEPPPDHFEHTVQFRETLSVIAKHYGIPMDELMRANGIADANRINQGQTLWIPPTAITRQPPPAPEPPEPPAAPVAVATTEAPPTVIAPGDREQYTVRRGDSLSMIGKRLATDWLVMAQINGLAAPYNLHAGMVLLVPNSDDLVRLGSTHAKTRLTTVPPPGARVGVGREFVVVLSTQMAYAYEDGILKKTALIASGLPATPTVQGDFRIYRKVRKQRMSGPGYSLPNVEWVMYFYRGYAFHGTWWHTNFGQPQSKGCINMTNADAKWFYQFGSIGTPVHVRH